MLSIKKEEKMPEKLSKKKVQNCLKSFRSRLRLPDRCPHWRGESVAHRQPDHNHRDNDWDNFHHQNCNYLLIITIMIIIILSSRISFESKNHENFHLCLPLCLAPRLPTVCRASHTWIQSSWSSLSSWYRDIMIMMIMMIIMIIIIMCWWWGWWR